MRDRTTYIKLDRNITSWGWYKDEKTFKLWIHLLLSANIKDHTFMGVEIHRGELATSYKSLAIETGLSVKSVRTALEHLKATGEVAVNRQAKFSIISIPRFDYYQNNRQASGQSIGTPAALNGQQSKNVKNEKEGRGGAQRRSPAHESVYRMALRLQQEVDEELAAEEAAEAAEDSE